MRAPLLSHCLTVAVVGWNRIKVYVFVMCLKKKKTKQAFVFVHCPLFRIKYSFFSWKQYICAACTFEIMVHYPHNVYVVSLLLVLQTTF